jgi:hypothetical protein
MTRLRGRAPRGERCHASAPCGHWKTTTMISSIRLDGTTAAMTIEGATDTEVFRAYVAELLCPTLRHGDLVVMDNLAPHKSEPTLALIAAAGTEVLFLPAYCLRTLREKWQAISAALRFPGPQPHRKDVEQSQSPPAQRRGTQPRGSRGSRRHSPRPSHPTRCPRLVRLFRL